MSLNSISLDIDELKSKINGLTDAKKISVGGFKIVFDAMLSDKREALKLILLPKTEDVKLQEAFNQESLGRITREIETLNKCQRPEIVKLGQLKAIRIVLSNEDFIAYSEEFIEGSNLGEIIKSQSYQPPTFEELKTLTLSLLNGIKELWDMKVVHRDIKPLNVMKTSLPDRPFILLDLGIAFIVSEIHLTIFPSQREPLGTWKYMAPEMLNRDFRDNISFRSDLYTIGQTIFEFATGSHPLINDSDDKVQTISRILRENCKNLHLARSDLPIEFCSTINQMMKKNPALRPGNLDRLISKMENL